MVWKKVAWAVIAIVVGLSAVDVLNGHWAFALVSVGASIFALVCLNREERRLRDRNPGLLTQRRELVQGVTAP